jgi:hypothetical protein
MDSFEELHEMTTPVLVQKLAGAKDGFLEATRDRHQIIGQIMFYQHQSELLRKGLPDEDE